MINTSAEREALAFASSPWRRQTAISMIYVVDDDPNIRDVIAQTLKDEGYHVVPFAGGEEVLAAVDSVQPSLILLDLMMPNVSGWDVLQQLRAEPKTTALPVVLISASRDLEQTSKQLEASAFLAKPFDLDQLVATVQTYIGTPPLA